MGNANSSTDTETKPLRKHVSRATGRSAVLTGATGATGKFVLGQMIISPEWTKITVIHRREIDLNVISKQCSIPFTETQKAKVCINVTDMTKLCENDEAIEKNAKLFIDHDVSICTLGSTREKSKNAAAFRAVDFDIVRDIGTLSKRAGIKHFTLLSTQAANAGIWANEWKISAGMWYLKVKGEIENEIISQKFDRLSIFRPGFLAREERVTGGFISKLFVCDLANVLVYDAESDDVDAKEAEPPITYEAKDIARVLDSAVQNFNALLQKKTENDANNDEEENKKEVVERKEECDAPMDKPQGDKTSVDVKEVVKDEPQENITEDESQNVAIDEPKEEITAADTDKDKKDELATTQEAQDSQEFVKIEKEDAVDTSK